jgi:hypothetical protein
VITKGTTRHGRTFTPGREMMGYAT